MNPISFRYYPLFTLLLTTAALSQEAIPVGKGSYSSFPPPGTAKGKAEETDKRKLYLVKEDERPVPSNKWYQNLILQPFAKGLWPFPHRVDTSDAGLAVYYPTQWKSDGSEMVADYPLLIGGKDFKPLDARANEWSDWLVSFRLAQSSEKAFDVTLGEGMPYVWVECRGVTPTLSFGPKSGPAKPAPTTRYKLFDTAGKEATLPTKANALRLECEGRSYGVFTPEGTRFEKEGDTINVVFAGKEQYLVVCPLPSDKALTHFQKYAYSVPRDSKFSWRYDPSKGTVATTWKITTQPLRGSETNVLQGWLPHHYRESTHDLTFDESEFATARGKMRCAVGKEFTITYPFHGIVPNLPLPTKSEGWKRERMVEQLKPFTANRGFARDTYGGGKDLVRQAQAAHIARQLGEPSADTIHKAARDELVNWLTYTTGEKERFFAFYPKRKGLVGFPSAYGSEHFSDHHFHYGYFTFAAGLLSQTDAAFAADYGPMARLVAKQYANGDRDDKRFPFLRTFDIWRGHSWADGNGFPNGNNQESTSEAVQSWAGLILLGEALGDQDMTSLGVMGYAMETRATMEYWFNRYGDVFPKEWKHPINGMIWSSSNVWGTWFTASPAWIYGIQWIPTSPAAFYQSSDPAFARKAYEAMASRFEAWEKANAAKKPGTVAKPASIKTFGGELGSYHLGYIMQYDAKAVTDELDRLWEEPGDKVAHNIWMANIYYMAHSLKELGAVDGTCRGDSPTSMVYRNEATKTRTFVVWNPTGKERLVTFYQGEKALGQATIPPRSLVGIDKLQPLK